MTIPAPTPISPETKHEVLQVFLSTEPVLAERRQIRLVVAVHRPQGPAEHLADDLGERDALPVQQVGGAMENAVEVHQARYADAEPDHGRARQRRPCAR